MRTLRAAIVLPLALSLGTARAEPPAPAPAPPSNADEAPVERPTTPRRRIVQALGLGAIALVVAGTVSFGVAVSRFQDYRAACNPACTQEQIEPGRLAQGVGWGLVGAGLALGVATMILAFVDGRPEPKKVALVPGLGGLALVGTY